MTNPTLTQAQLREQLMYDPDTGIFTRRVALSTRVSVGDIAGKVGKRGYKHIRVLVNKYPAHRLAWLYMTGTWPEHRIDHCNGDKGDNRFFNLRDATIAENSRNVGLRKDNKTGVKGVHLTKQGRWKAVIQVDRVQQYLGTYATMEEAAAARNAAGRILHREFHRDAA